MGKKYIVKLDDNKLAYTAIIIDGVPYIKPLQLLPYTEPDLDAIRNEAYEKGVQDTKQHWVDAPRTCAYKLGYESGLNDAWETVRKISSMDSATRDEIFGLVITSNIFDENTASEAIEKIRQYEQEKAFHVGDEFVNGNGDKFVITKMDGEEIDRYIDEYGKTYVMNVKYSEMRKTGRHFPEIAEVLQKMKENNDNK